MVRAPGPAGPGTDESLPSRTFGPPASVVVGTLVTGVVFAVVLEFLVIISFVGQRLWRDPLLFTDLLFTLPALLWLLVVAFTMVLCVRVLTAWLQIDERGFELRSLFRRTRRARWDQVGEVVAVRDIERGSATGELLDAPETAYDGVYVMGTDGRRLLAVSSRFFGPRAQEMTLRRAREAGVRIGYIEAITPNQLRAQVPQAMSFVDRHPQLLLIALVLFYVGHNLLTFIVWGL